MKKLLVAFLTILLLAGCGNETYDKAMEQGKLALAKWEFDKASGLFELALEEEPKDIEAKKFYESLKILSQVQADVKNSQWDDALTKANSLLKEKNVTGSIKKQLKQYIDTAEAGKEQYKAVSEKVENIRGLVSEKNYTEAQKLISDLKQDESTKTGFDRFSEEVNKLEITINEEIKKQMAAEEAAKEKARIEAERKKNQISWSTYHNGRFGFTINYPKDWILGPEPTNGDGRALYQGNNAEVIASASNYIEEIKQDISNYEKITTSTGYEAFLLVQNNGSKISFKGLIINGEIQFNLTATMNQSFYQKYSEVLKKMFDNVKLDYDVSQ
jgi:hypothetical protein